MVLCYFMNPGCQVNEMSTKALGYQKVVEENRKLYNMVQDLKGFLLLDLKGHFLFHYP